MLSRFRSRFPVLLAIAAFVVLAVVPALADPPTAPNLNGGPSQADYTNAATFFFQGLSPIMNYVLPLGAVFLAIKMGPMLLKRLVLFWSR